MLLPPELGEERGQDPVENLQPVHQGVVGGAEGDEQLFPRDTRAAVVNVEAAGRVPFHADAAAEAVTLENPGAPSAEVDQVMPLGGVTGGAEPPYERHGGSAGPAPQGKLTFAGGKARSNTISGVGNLPDETLFLKTI